MSSKVVVLATGGTIAMRYDEAHGGVVPAVTGGDLLSAVPSHAGLCQVEVVEFGNIPSFQMSMEKWLLLAEKVDEILAKEEVYGLVLTHGTDTMEDTAYFLDLFLAPKKPVCLTGAMRSASDLSPDGPYNLYCAILAASSSQLVGSGVVVVMNGEIHLAERVIKMHKSAVQSFCSADWGPVGHIRGSQVTAQPFWSKRMPLRPVGLLPKVPIVKLYVGMDEEVFDILLAKKIDGIVLEGYGLGNVPASVVPAIKKILNAGIPVVAASRVPLGATDGVYAAEGGAGYLASLGVFLSGALSSQKARIKLMLALGVTRDLKVLSMYFT